MTTSLALVCCLATISWKTPADSPVEGPDSFIRFIRSAHVGRLETASVTYEDLDTSRRVTLIAVVHVADRAYYERLSRDLGRFDAVLFEGVRGDPDETDPTLTLVDRLQNALGDYLGLTHQKDVLRLEGPRFIHADVTARELRRWLDEAGVSLVPGADALEFVGPMLGVALRLLSPDAGETTGFRARLRDGAKLALAELLGRGMAIYERFKSDDQRTRDEVIVRARNRVAFERLAELLDDPNGPRHVAIVYGAAHHPDFASRLSARGAFYPVRIEWLPAWTLGGLEPQIIRIPSAPPRPSGPKSRFLHEI